MLSLFTIRCTQSLKYQGLYLTDLGDGGMNRTVSQPELSRRNHKYEKP